MTGLHREGELGLWKGASSKKALHVIIISDRRGLGHLCSTGEQNGRLPFRCQTMLSNGKIQGAQKAGGIFLLGISVGNQGHTENQGVLETSSLIAGHFAFATTSPFVSMVQDKETPSLIC